MGKGGKGGSGAADAARAEEAARQERIRAGTQSINSTFDSQFNDEFYEERRQSYLDYATPQLEQQYDDARKSLTYALDRAGTTDSSIRAAREAELQRAYDTNMRTLSDTALNYENDARNNVESARASLVQQLNASADQDAAIQNATSRAEALSAPVGYSPIGQMFSSFTGALGQQAQYEQTAGLTGPSSYYNTGLFGPSKKSVSVQN